MKNYIVIAGFFLSTIKILSQNYVDIFRVQGSTTPSNAFDTSTSKTKINEVMADLTVPVKINERLSLVSGVIYENIQARLFTDGDIKSFGSTTLKLGANKQFNDFWTGTLVLLPKIASDYKRVGMKDFQMGALGFMKYKKQEDFYYKVGLYFNTELFGPFFVPLVGLYYLSSNKKFETNLMLPLAGDMNYKLFPFVNAGLNFNGQTRSYHLTDVTPGEHSSYLVRATNELYAYLKFNITKGFSIQTKIGQSVARTYRVYDENDKVAFGLPLTYIGHKRHQLNTNFSDGLIFQVVMLYRFHLDKK